jgi:hypothetical protein
MSIIPAAAPQSQHQENHRMTDPTLISPASTEKPKRPVALWVALGVAAAAIVATAITVPLVSAHNQRVAEEEAEAARLATFRTALASCDARSGGDTGIDILDDGEAIELTGAGKSLFSGLQADVVFCVLDEIDAPAALKSKMQSTRALDGRQSDDWDGFEVSWSYHPDDGLNVLIEHD